VSDTRLRIAAAQYPVDYLSDWSAYQYKITEWVERAVEERAALLLFPEYFSMELASLFEERIYRSLSLQLEAMQSLLKGFQALLGSLASQHRIHIVGGTFPVRQPDDSYRNRCYWFYPDGRLQFQDKLQMTRFETEQWLISAGDTINLFETPFGKVGVSICYDSEFPLIARRQVEQGADLILVPSCTDTLAGFHRVQIGSRARALENQCYVVQSALIGTAEWSEAVDINNGAAAIYTPVDYGFPDDGILAMGELNQPQWIYADVDLAALRQVRETGQVFNHRDWNGQYRIWQS
jgi:predicted amidohydrolase